MRLGTGMMKGRIKNANVPTLKELLELCREMGTIKIYACSTTMELMKVKKEELIPEVDEIIGAAAYLDIAMDSDIQLFI
jgi:peroxiredoxin family protein